MCSGNLYAAGVSGSAKGAQGWFPVQRAQVVYDHPFHAQLEEALIIDFVNPERGPGARLSVELSADSARDLVRVIEDALRQGDHSHSPSVANTS